MLIDAVFPAASEVVMVYGGAVAVGRVRRPARRPLRARRSTRASGRTSPSRSPGTLGYMLGSIGGWAIGNYGGRPLVERHGRWFHLRPEKIERAERWFDRFGTTRPSSIGRIMPVVRSFVSIPAGLARMPLGRFTLLTIPGSAVWCFALAGVGWALGTQLGGVPQRVPLGRLRRARARRWLAAG